MQARREDPDARLLHLRGQRVNVSHDAVEDLRNNGQAHCPTDGTDHGVGGGREEEGQADHSHHGPRHVGRRHHQPPDGGRRGEGSERGAERVPAEEQGADGQTRGGDQEGGHHREEVGDAELGGQQAVAGHWPEEQVAEASPGRLPGHRLPREQRDDHDQEEVAHG